MHCALSSLELDAHVLNARLGDARSKGMQLRRPARADVEGQRALQGYGAVRAHVHDPGVEPQLRDVVQIRKAGR